jgi:hypothetical protein
MTELTKCDLGRLHIPPPRDEMWEAWQVSDDEINILVHDSDGGSWLDPPNIDNSGEDAWEWIDFRNGEERDRWLENAMICANCGVDLMDWSGTWIDDTAGWDYGDDEDAEVAKAAHCPASGADPQVHIPRLPETHIVIERYEHGQVVYAPIGEASFVDRQWDVAYGVAVMRFTKPDTIGPDSDPDKLLNFARAVCQEYTSWCNGDVFDIVRWDRVPPPIVPLMEPGDFTDQWVEGDRCGGFIGYDIASKIAQTGDW